MGQAQASGLNRARKTGWIAVLCCGVSGCGYSTARPFARTDPDGNPIRTVAVDVFESREFRRGLELQITESLAKRIEAETPYRLANKSRADTVITGEVKEVRQATIGRDFRENRPRETAATVVVSVRWKDLRTGRILMERANLLQTVDYIRPVGENFYEASQQSMDKLAVRIVEEMESPW